MHAQHVAKQKYANLYKKSRKHLPAFSLFSHMFGSKRKHQIYLISAVGVENCAADLFPVLFEFPAVTDTNT